jgi:hypothetical protein
MTYLEKYLLRNIKRTESYLEVIITLIVSLVELYKLNNNF